VEVETIRIDKSSIAGMIERDGPWRRPQDMFLRSEDRSVDYVRYFL
jgi:hypothetical protein